MPAQSQAHREEGLEEPDWGLVQGTVFVMVEILVTLHVGSGIRE